MRIIEIEGSSSLRIYQVPVPRLFRPDKAPFRYPLYAQDWGVEQDFSKFLQSSQFLTNDLHEATHLFLPIFWTRYWLQNNYAKDGHGPLNEFLNSLELDESKVFTICQYDDGPLVDFHFGKGMYLSSRQTPDAGRDIPLLATSLPRYGYKKRKKKYLMSFAGRFETHPLRMELRDVSTNRESVLLANQNLNARQFTSLIHQSFVVLSPRGYGGSSFRFFEAMQVGSVPCLIGDVDTRPFKSQIQWDKISLYFKTPLEAITTIESMDSKVLERMGTAAADVYHRLLKLGKWNQLLINDLYLQGD